VFDEEEEKRSGYAWPASRLKGKKRINHSNQSPLKETSTFHKKKRAEKVTYDVTPLKSTGTSPEEKKQFKKY